MSDTVMETLPSNVPSDRVVDFDYFHPQAFENEDVYLALKRLHAGPDIQWTSRNGGHWIITRAEDQRWLRGEPVVFSHTEFVLPAGLMNTLLPPANVDPPYHARFRAVLNPYFTPGSIKRLEGRIRKETIRLVEQMKPRGRCEFVGAFARVMPVVIFLNILDLPTERADEFLDWGRSYINASDQQTKDAAAAAIAGFLTGVLDERQAEPRNDLFTSIANWRNNPRYQGEEEVIGMAMTSFLAGLDTVSGMLSFTAHHLATDPDARRRLVQEPAIAPRAAEEYLRRYGISNSGRVVTRDIERDGIMMKRGDYVLVVDALASMDERAYPDPMRIDFDRDNRVHDTFGSGVHRCLGEHLARMELIVFLEEWMKRLPEFHIDPQLPAQSYSGVVMGMSQLGLIWD
jgi:cytochrome P450